ncbi:MAG: DUF5667 domain-containing protein [Anaerolineae bacterium]|jgi:hypothetical protein
MNRARHQSRQALIEALEGLRETELVATGGAAAMGRARFLSLAASLRRERDYHTPRGAKELLRGIRMPLGRTWRLAITVVTVLALLLGGTSVGVAAQDQIPGDPLYPVKTGLEEGRALVTITPPSRVRLGVDYADRRVVELDALVAAERWPGVPIATDGLVRWVEVISVNLERVVARGGAEAAALAELVYQRSQGWSAALERAAPRVPPSLQPALAATATLVDEVAAVADEGRRAVEVIRSPTATASPSPGLSPSASPSVSPSPSVSVSPSPTPTPTGTATPSPAPAERPPATERPRATATPRPTQTPGRTFVPPGQTRTPPGHDKRVTPPGHEGGG